MNINQLQCFVEIAQTGSMSQAASNLFMNRSTVSIIISTLEDELGYALFKRNNKGVILTENGRAILQEAQVVLDYVERWKNLSVTDTQINGTVNILASNLLCSTIITDIVMKSRQDHPELNLHVSTIENVADSLTETLINTSTNIAVCYFWDRAKEESTLSYLSRHNYIADILFSNEPVVVMHKDTHLYEKKSLYFSDLQECFITYTPCQRDFFDVLKVDNLFPKARRIEVPKITDGVSIIAKNSGDSDIIAISGAEIMRADILPQSCGIKELVDTSLQFNAFLIHPNLKNLTPSEQYVVNLIRSVV